MKAEVKILIEGYTTADTIVDISESKSRPTITLVRDKDADIVMVVDPGALSDQQILIDSLKAEGLTVNDVNIVCVTHSHLDHYKNIGMFPKAKILEYFGLWNNETMVEWPEHFTENILILKTPGHDYSSITLFVTTEIGKVAICGDVFWREDSPTYDMYATDQEKLKKSRVLVSKMADWIIPGHGGMYKSKQLSSVITEQIKVVKNDLGKCRKCHRQLFVKKDRCECQPKLCYHCCECGVDCELCNCKHRR